jgi:hypothetical protein
MKSIYCLLTLMFVFVYGYAQEQACKVSFSPVLIKNASDEKEILNFINSNYANEIGASTFALIAKTESPTAFHYLFQQEYMAIPTYHADIKVNVSKQGKIVSIYSNLIDVNALQKPTVFPAAIMDALSERWRNANVTNQQARQSYCFIASATAFVPAVKIVYNDNNKIAHEVVIDQNESLQTRITSSFLAQDSLVTGKVFNPDPLTSANVVYGGGYQDFNDSDVVVLNNQRQTQTFKAHFDGSNFNLKNQYIELRDNNGDGILPVTSSSPLFDYTRHQSGFEDVNAYYHLTKQSDYIRSLGFNATSQLVYPDPHGGTGDNSFFNEPNTIYFGTGGVDDAEDADVVIHEYTHFVSYNAAPSTNSGQDRNSIDEGTCDYFAASYSKSISAYNWTKVFNWDGNPPFWNGRVVNTTKRYPQNISNNIYKDGEMWSSTLMQIHDELGKATTDSLVLQTMYLFASNMTYPQVADALLQADTLLFGGKHFCTLYYFLLQRGYKSLVNNPCGYTGIAEPKLNAVELMYSSKGFILHSDDPTIAVENYSMYNSTGQLMYQLEGSSFDKKDMLSPGVYLIRAKSNTRYTTYKYVVF